MAIAAGGTLADYLVPSQKSRGLNLLRDGLLIIGFSIFIALCARVSFPIPFSPVPITLQTLGVLLTGAALGSKRGGLALLVYLAEGAAGLPVFAPVAGSPGAWMALFPFTGGFTGGYLWSFPIAAFVTGLLCERGLDRSFLTSALAMLPGTLITYLIGATWLGLMFHWNVSESFMQGVVPFLPGDIFKLIVAALLLPIAWSIVRSVRHGRTRSE